MTGLLGEIGRIWDCVGKDFEVGIGGLAGTGLREALGSFCHVGRTCFLSYPHDRHGMVGTTS